MACHIMLPYYLLIVHKVGMSRQNFTHWFFPTIVIPLKIHLKPNFKNVKLDDLFKRLLYISPIVDSLIPNVRPEQFVCLQEFGQKPEI